MLRGSLRVGRIAGTTIRIHWTAVAIAVLLGTVVVAVGVVSFFVAILLHEIAHALVAKRFGIGTSTIDRWGLGGMARLAKEAPTPRADGWIAAAGPLCNVALGGSAIGVGVLVDRFVATGDV